MRKGEREGGRERKREGRGKERSGGRRGGGGAEKISRGGPKHGGHCVFGQLSGRMVSGCHFTSPINILRMLRSAAFDLGACGRISWVWSGHHRKT